jgi:hypothetical protein
MLSPSTTSPYGKSLKRGASFVKLTERADRVEVTAKPSSKNNYKNVSKRELIRYLLYTVIFFIVLSLQIDTRESFLQNRSILMMHYPKPENLKITMPTQHFYLKIMDGLVSNHFSEESFGAKDHSYLIPKKIKPISDIRIRINRGRAEFREGSDDLWGIHMGEDRSEYGKNPNNTFKFNENSRKL